MSKAAVFVLVFLLLFVLTLAIPIIPPGNMITSLFELPGTMIFLGLSLVDILNGIINGLIWGLVVFIIFVVFKPAPKDRELEPLRAPSYPTIAKPIPTEATSVVTTSKKRQEKRQTEVRKKRTYTSLDQDIETIEGIGPAYGNRLRNSGVRVVDDLLSAGSTRSKRRILANKIDVAPAILLKWVYRADFFRIRGIGTQYSSLLESAGVNTVADLSRRNPKNLHARLRAINIKKNLVRRTPPYKTIERWIKNAKNLERLLED
jgi:predicted flap endonuclease-1-like 5' DNA nuclease